MAINTENHLTTPDRSPSRKSTPSPPPNMSAGQILPPRTTIKPSTTTPYKAKSAHLSKTPPTSPTMTWCMPLSCRRRSSAPEEMGGVKKAGKGKVKVTIAGSDVKEGNKIAVEKIFFEKNEEKEKEKVTTEAFPEYDEEEAMRLLAEMESEEYYY